MSATHATNPRSGRGNARTKPSPETTTAPRWVKRTVRSWLDGLREGAQRTRGVGTPGGGPRPNRLALFVAPVTLLVLLPAAARARIVAPDLGRPDLHRRGGRRAAGGIPIPLLPCDAVRRPRLGERHGSRGLHLHDVEEPARLLQHVVFER